MLFCHGDLFVPVDSSNVFPEIDFASKMTSKWTIHAFVFGVTIFHPRATFVYEGIPSLSNSNALRWSPISHERKRHITVDIEEDKLPLARKASRIEGA